MSGWRVSVWISVFFSVFAARPAAATYSIAAVDASTGEVGGAVTSCVGTLDLSLVYGSAPGAGVIHAQAQLDQRLRGRDRAVEQLKQGIAPEQILSEITNTSFDSGAATRQYGIVDVMGRAAGYTGERAQAFRADQRGKVASFTYSVQGNILTSQKVLDQAGDAFEAQGCDLAERLMRALEAGANNGEGDSRCTSSGIPSDSAFIQVDRPGEAAGSYLKLSVSNTRPNSPLPKLRAAFDAWRATHPCAAGGGGAGRGGSVAVGGRGGVGGDAAVGGSGMAAGSGGRGSAGGSLATSGTGGSGTGAGGVGVIGVSGAGSLGSSGAGTAGLAAVSGAGAGARAAAGASALGASAGAGVSGRSSAAAGSSGAVGSIASPNMAAAVSGSGARASSHQGCSVGVVGAGEVWYAWPGLLGALWLLRRRRRA